MSRNTYTCDACGEEFEKGWTDEEAKAEFEKNFPGLDFNPDDLSIICDDCYRLNFVNGGH